jgi:hypothetical protein
MVAIKRITPADARQKTLSGAMLVCAYESEEQCTNYHLDRAISLKAFEKLLPLPDRNREIIFYCS